MDKKTYGIIKFQRLYKYLKLELDNSTELLNQYKNIFVSMCRNLQYLNHHNILINKKFNYFNILDNLTKINTFINSYPNRYTISNLKEKSIDDIYLDIHSLSNIIIKTFNTITPNDLNKILEVLLSPEWFYHFNTSDLDILHLLTKIFVPIRLWDSDYHNNLSKEQENTSTDTIQLKPNIESISERDALSKKVLDDLMDQKSNITSIIIGEISLPGFLKTLSNLSSNDENKDDTSNEYNYVEILSKFDNTTDNIILSSNNKSCSLMEETYGLTIYIKINSKIIVIEGFIIDDIFNIQLNSKFLKSKLIEVKKYINYEISSVPKGYKKNFIDTINIRDLFVHSKKKIGNNLIKLYDNYTSINGNPLMKLINDFLLANKFRKYNIIYFLLLGHETDNKLAYLLYDILKIKDKQNQHKEIVNSLHYIHRNRLIKIKNILNEDSNRLSKLSDTDISYEKQISFMKVDDKIKSKALEKLKAMKNNFQGDNKAQSWLDGILKIPFGIYKKNNIMTKKDSFIEKIKSMDNIELTSCYQIEEYINTNFNNCDQIRTEWNQYNTDKNKYLNLVKQTLNDSVYGHQDAKKQILGLFGQWINGKTKGAILGLWGPPGTGKTSLAKKGIAKCLLDNDNTPRPFAFLPIGGSTNGSTLVGHNYTYVGSTWGRIVDILIDNKCMNPIIFIDEVDKVSQTEHGKEIISILTHLTDSTQNDHFEDKYFSGVPFDLSKAFIIFSFNNINVIDPILKDRITIVETKPFTLEEKIVIINDYILPELIDNIGFSKNEIILSDNIIEHIINTYTNEAGVRKIKEKLVDIIRDINLKCIYENIKLPFQVTEEYVSKLFEDKPKVRIKHIPSKPTVGLVNGLYATASGLGGITVIQVIKYPSDKMLELTITGQQGEVMKESCEYAIRIAYNLLTDEEQKNIQQKIKDKNCFGIHIHTPDAATKKDGPSAGAAMTLAIYSVLTNRKVNNLVALTGEIDLCKNVTAIGGVYAKLYGAKKAGVKKALIPAENLEDLQILRNKNISPEDEHFTVETISCVEDVIQKCLV